MTSINTDIDVLLRMKGSLQKFSNRINEVERKFQIFFYESDWQIGESIKKIDNDIYRMQEQGRRSDTFICDTCGKRMLLKVYGDCKKCNGCEGIMRRVYNNSTLSQQINEAIEKRNRINILRGQYEEEKKIVLALLSSLTGNDVADTDLAIRTIGRCIDIIDDYNKIQFDSGSSKKKNKYSNNNAPNEFICSLGGE